jgi:putative DNA primase/helicase
MIKGFQEFTRMGGLCPPQKIIDLRASFRTSNDTVEQFTVTWCDTTDREASTPVKSLYDTYVVWCSNSGIEPIAASEFGKSLQRLGFDVRRKKIGNHRLGIKLLPGSND